MRARLLAARSFPEAAESLVLEASRAGSCGAAAALAEMASRRDAVALEDEAALALGRCPGGVERLAEHRRMRGDLAGAAAAWTAIARAGPARIDARMALARVLVARGNAAAAVAEIEDLARIWPADAQLQRRLGEMLELSGRPGAARAARERALALDGSDLGLRRALALEEGRELLSDLAVDGPATIRAYEAARIPVTTPASLVLDAAAVEAWPDGSTTERTHQVIHVHDARGVEKWGEVELPHGATLLKLETRKRDGRVLEPEAHGGDKRTLSAAGLEPGDYLEVEWLRSHPTRRPASPGWISDPFFFRGEDLPFFLSTYTVAAPAGALRLDAKNMPTPPVVRDGGRDVMRAEARRAAALVSEPGAPGISEYVPMVMAGSGEGIDGLALAAADAFLERIRPGREIEALARSLRYPVGAPPRTGEALVRAAHQAVMEKVEGTGPFTDQASHVLSRGRGSRTLLLVALLDALAIPARVALVRPFYVDPQPWLFPRLDLYSVPVVRAEAGGRIFWLDPAARWSPFGALPPGARDAEALVLPRPGEALRRERTPALPAPDRSEVLLRIQVASGGDATIEGVETYEGFEGAGAKVAIEQLDEAGRRRALEQALSRSFRSLELEELRFEGEREIGVAARHPLPGPRRRAGPDVGRAAGDRRRALPVAARGPLRAARGPGVAAPHRRRRSLLVAHRGDPAARRDTRRRGAGEGGVAAGQLHARGTGRWGPARPGGPGGAPAGAGGGGGVPGVRAVRGGGGRGTGAADGRGGREGRGGRNRSRVRSRPRSRPEQPLGHRAVHVHPVRRAGGRPPHHRQPPAHERLDLAAEPGPELRQLESLGRAERQHDPLVPELGRPDPLLRRGGESPGVHRGQPRPHLALVGPANGRVPGTHATHRARPRAQVVLRAPVEQVVPRLHPGAGEVGDLVAPEPGRAEHPGHGAPLRHHLVVPREGELPLPGEPREGDVLGQHLGVEGECVGRHVCHGQ